ncbi:uncharacterized protein LOC123444173 isoform X2 [Hordeum vulgare subsp. vulgare]|uniref:uncharacterized protein LOC123444173 isoform X2 n=1 Tax=Hordeum vulgare subsp. vulgare TaxID=112509 RepID=UPI000B473E54|nr:uncharacterized protein LOC123444173 isoform X2 [Hordeum vulgare subsp. vulgare]
MTGTYICKVHTSTHSLFCRTRLSSIPKWNFELVEQAKVKEKNMILMGQEIQQRRAKLANFNGYGAQFRKRHGNLSKNSGAILINDSKDIWIPCRLSKSTVRLRVCS